MAPRIQYNNQGLISQGPVRLMYPRPVTPLEQARFQKRTGMEYPVLNSWAQQQFGYPLSPVGSTAAPVYQGGLFPAHLQSASNAYRRLQQTNESAPAASYGTQLHNALGLWGLAQIPLRTWGPAAARATVSGAPLVSATARALTSASPAARSFQFLPRGFAPGAGALGAGLMHGAEWMKTPHQIAAEQRQREQAVRNSFQGNTTAARLGRVLYNLGDQADRASDAVGTVGGAVTGNPWLFLLSNGSTSAMGRSYADALSSKGNSEEQRIRNSIWNAMPWYEKLGGGSVSEQLEPAAYASYVSRGTFNPELYRSWYAAQQSRGLNRKEIMKAREDLVKRNPLYFESGISDADRTRSASELYQQAMKRESK